MPTCRGWGTRLSTLVRRVRSAGGSPAAPGLSLEGGFDSEEVIFQDPTSGRKWRFGEVHFLGTSDKRRLETARPQVWRAYRLRLFRDLPSPPLSGS